MWKYIVFLFIYSVNSEYFNFNDHPSCSSKNTSCTGFLSNRFPKDFCQQTHFGANNSTICDTKYDKNLSRSQNTNLGTLILAPFYGDSRTIFNITFVDIKFKKLLIYFQEYTNNTHLIPDHCNVKDFTLSNSVGNSSFSYICPWFEAKSEGNEVEFHYEYGRKEYETRKKFRFRVPSHRDLDNESLKYFLYLDITELSHIILNIVPLFNFNKTNFIVTVTHIHNNISTIKSSLNITSYQYSYQTELIEGEYVFRVQPTDCEVCDEQTSVKIRIVSSSSSTLIIGIVGVSILIPIFMIIVYMWTGKCSYELKEKPYVLLITVPTNDAHFHVGTAFAKFLEQFHIKVILDVNELIQKNHQNWIKAHIQKASHIIYLQSRDDINDRHITYKALFDDTIFFYNPQNTSPKKECIIKFTYSSDAINESLAHITTIFNFSTDLDKILKFLIGVNVVMDLKNDCFNNLLQKISIVENEPPVKKTETSEEIIVVKLPLPIPTPEIEFKNNKKIQEEETHEINLDGYNFGEQNNKQTFESDNSSLGSLELKNDNF